MDTPFNLLYICPPFLPFAGVPSLEEHPQVWLDMWGVMELYCSTWTSQPDLGRLLGEGRTVQREVSWSLLLLGTVLGACSHALV